MLTSWIVLVLECKCNKNYRWKLCDYEIKERRLRYEEKFNEMKKECPMFIKPDLFLVSDILFVIAIVLYIAEIGSDRSRRWSVAIVVICWVAQLLFGKSKVKNKLGSDIEYLQEGGGKDRPSYLGSGEGQHDIDGVRFSNKVYKIPDGVHVTVNKKGKVIPHSISGAFGYYKEGGVRDNPLDSSWNALFPKEKWI